MQIKQEASFQLFAIKAEQMDRECSNIIVNQWQTRCGFVASVHSKQAHDVEMKLYKTSMRRDDVASTSMCCQYNVMCLLG